MPKEPVRAEDEHKNEHRGPAEGGQRGNERLDPAEAGSAQDRGCEGKDQKEP